MAQRQRGPAPSACTCPGKRSWSSPWAQGGTVCDQCLTPGLKKRNSTTWYGKLATALSHGRGQCSASGLWWHVALEKRWLRLTSSAPQNPGFCGAEWWPQAWHSCWERPAQKRHDSEPFPNKRTAVLLYYLLEVRRVTELTEKLLYESLSREVLFLPST